MQAVASITVQGRAIDGINAAAVRRTACLPEMTAINVRVEPTRWERCGRDCEYDGVATVHIRRAHHDNRPRSRTGRNCDGDRRVAPKTNGHWRVVERCCAAALRRT